MGATDVMAELGRTVDDIVETSGEEKIGFFL